MSRVYDGEWVVSSLLDDRAERFGDEVFIITEGDTLTFGQLRDRAAQVAGGLIEMGIQPGDRVATMLPASIDYIVFWFGIMWAGAVDVPINTEYKGEFLGHVLIDSDAAILITQDRWVGRIEELDLPGVHSVVVVGNDTPPRPGIKLVAAGVLMNHAPVERVARDETDLVYIMYTSGTTGASKGVMHVNRSSMWNVVLWIDILALTHEDVAYSVFPLFHVTARLAIVTASMWAGGKVVLRSGFSLSNFWDDIRANGTTWFGYMGAVIHLLHSQPPRPDDSDNPIRIAFGAAAPPSLFEDFERRFGIRLHETYGSTELGPASAPSFTQRKVGKQGLALPHVVLEIHDEEDLPCPPGVQGEICVRPAVPYGIFQGYWKLPEYTLQQWRNLWFHTGDGGVIDEDGFLQFTDRTKDSIRRRGENISSFEVERTVQKHPAVLEAGAYAVPSELTEDEVMVAVVLQPSQVGDPETLFRFCIDNMPRFAVPRYLRFVDELPKTPSQRIQKYKLRAEGITADSVDRDTLGIVIARD